MTETVNRLFDIADPEYIVASRNQLYDRILNVIAVLKFIDHDHGETFLIFLCDSVVVGGEDLQGKMFHVIEINDLCLLFQLLIDLEIGARACN